MLLLSPLATCRRACQQGARSESQYRQDSKTPALMPLQPTYLAMLQTVV